MLETMCSEFKAYHYELWLPLKWMKQQERNVFFHEHQRKTLEFVDRLRDLLATPQPSVDAQVSMKGRLIDWKVDLIRHVYTLIHLNALPNLVSEPVPNEVY